MWSASACKEQEKYRGGGIRVGDSRGQFGLSGSRGFPFLEIEAPKGNETCGFFPFGIPFFPFGNLQSNCTVQNNHFSPNPDFAVERFQVPPAKNRKNTGRQLVGGVETDRFVEGYCCLILSGVLRSAILSKWPELLKKTEDRRHGPVRSNRIKTEHGDVALLD